jgi:hypothetical protein
MSTKCVVFRDLVWVGVRYIFLTPHTIRIPVRSGKQKSELCELVISLLVVWKRYWQGVS